jgi:hypothetical protein
MKLKIMFVAFALALAAGIGAVAVANYGDACVYKPEPIECPCTTCSLRVTAQPQPSDAHRRGLPDALARRRERRRTRDDADLD